MIWTFKWTNSCNTDILHAWKANMGLQYISDPYSCIMYVTSYIMKSERAMSEQLRKVAKEARSEDVTSNWESLVPQGSECPGSSIWLFSLPLKKYRRQVIFVNTRPKENRVSVLQQMDEGDEDIFCKGSYRQVSSTTRSAWRHASCWVYCGLHIISSQWIH